MKPKSLTTADQVRELGLSVGDVIVGREEYSDGWCDAELTLLFVGKEVAVFNKRTRSNRAPSWNDVRENGNWTLAFRDWIKS
jgi:hypothetical protein